MSYTFLEHMADVKFRAEGSTKEEMFVSAADALNEVIRGEIEILEQEERTFEVSSIGKNVEGEVSEGVVPLVEGDKDDEKLLYNFLEEFLVLLDSEEFLVARVKEIKIDGNKLRCVLAGDKAENYKFTNDVKAVTYNEMFIKEENGKFVCQVVLDV